LKNVWTALQAAGRANELMSGNVSLRLNLLYSLALCDRITEAKAFYSRCKNDRMVGAAWNETLVSDLRELDAHGVVVKELKALLDEHLA
jgi:hypothetical protein